MGAVVSIIPRNAHSKNPQKSASNPDVPPVPPDDTTRGRHHRGGRLYNKVRRRLSRKRFALRSPRESSVGDLVVRMGRAAAEVSVKMDVKKHGLGAGEDAGAKNSGEKDAPVETPKRTAIQVPTIVITSPAEDEPRYI